MLKNHPIGILDSGIGGITVLKEIRKRLPQEDYIYYSDSRHNPYGEKSQKEVLEYVSEIVSFLMKQGCKAIVFACNTATALAIDEIRKQYPDFIFIGIEPAYKMVHDFAREKNTLVMATPGTLESERFQNLFHKYDNHRTYLQECPFLAKAIEDNQKEEQEKLLTQYLSPYKERKIENVVLGCTHYPLIKEAIRRELGPVTFFDGGEGIAKELERRLKEKNLVQEEREGVVTWIDSSKDSEKERRFREILNQI